MLTCHTHQFSKAEADLVIASLQQAQTVQYKEVFNLQLVSCQV